MATLKKEVFKISYEELAGVLEDYLRDAGEIDVEDNVLLMDIPIPLDDDDSFSIEVETVYQSHEEKQIELELTPAGEQYISDNSDWIPGDKVTNGNSTT